MPGSFPFRLPEDPAPAACPVPRMRAMTSSPEPARDHPVLVEQRGHTLLITLNRPAARNAVNLEVSRRVGQALARAEQSDQVRSVILTGTGDRAFTGGLDLKAVLAGEEPTADPDLEQWGFAGVVRHHISTPLIVAVNGACVGGGTEILLAADLAVAADTAWFALPEVGLGIIPGAGGAFRLPRQIPRKIAMELLLTGASITARRAHELGLVNRVVPGDQLLAAALELAETINAQSPAAVQAAKRVAAGMSDGQISDEAADWRRSDRESDRALNSADAAEGMAAFVAKRAPKWPGGSPERP